MMTHAPTRLSQITGCKANVLALGDGHEILFSYETPVAILFPDRDLWITNKKWSNTTTDHIRRYIGTLIADGRVDVVAELKVPQEQIDTFLHDKL